MGLKIKNYNILGVQWKIWLLEGGFKKNQCIWGTINIQLYNMDWTVFRCKGGLGKKDGVGGVFEGGLIPQYTLWKSEASVLKNWTKIQLSCPKIIVQQTLKRLGKA